MFLAIIQARMGSSRLPEKVLMPLAGTPSILHTVRRAQSASLLDHVIVATTDQNSDESLVSFLRKENIDCFQGSENDVLKRYYDCYQSFQQKNQVRGIVRITGDCPLIEPQIIDKVIKTFVENDLDYCGTNDSFAEGLDTEVFSPQVLAEAHNKATLKSEREHVALYIHNHKEDFKYHKISNPTNDGHYRITMDEDADYKVLSKIFENLQPNDLSIDKIKHFLDNNLDVAKINSSIIRNEGLVKSLANDSKVKEVK